MKIAICDDDYFAIEELLKLITMFDGNNNDFEVKCFHSSEKLKESFSTGLKFDIVFLDVANLSAFDDLIGTECDADEVVIIGVQTMSADIIEYMSGVYGVLDRKVDERKNTACSMTT